MTKLNGQLLERIVIKKTIQNIAQRDEIENMSERLRDMHKVRRSNIHLVRVLEKARKKWARGNI